MWEALLKRRLSKMTAKSDQRKHRRLQRNLRTQQLFAALMREPTEILTMRDIILPNDYIVKSGASSSSGQ